MNDLHRFFARRDLAATAEQLLADRRAGDPEAVKRGILTQQAADQRLRVATVIAATMRAIVDRRDPADPEQIFVDSGAREGAAWSEVRTDLAQAFEKAKAAALKPGASEGLEQRALHVGALASWFQPYRTGGNTPMILMAAAIERSIRRDIATRPPAAPAPFPARPQRRLAEQRAMI